jgi:predicted Zn finger-like uncharacterized protein
MIVTCSACKTRYLTDPAALGVIGRMVRCAKCGHTWMQTPPADLPRRVDVISPSSGQPDLSPPRFNLPAPYIPPRRRRARVRTVLAVAAVVVIAVVGAGYSRAARSSRPGRRPKRVYDLIGGLLTPSSATLDVGNLRIVHRPVDGMEVLVLQGEITNHGQHPQAVPSCAPRCSTPTTRASWSGHSPATMPCSSRARPAASALQAISPPNGFDRSAVTFVADGSSQGRTARASGRQPPLQRAVM